MSENTIKVTHRDKRVLDIISKTLKENKELTVVGVAKEMGVDQRTISNILSRKGGLYERIPDLRVIIGHTKIEYDISEIKKAATK